MKASFFSELKKRRVYQSAVAYAVVAWGITEILEGVVAGLGWPDWLATLAVILFVMGFPVAMFLAWVYDWTPQGIRRTAPSGKLGWLPIVASVVFLTVGSAGLFWLINPSGIVRVEQVGVAVMPCRYRGDPEYAHRGSGIAEIVSEHLAQSNQLFVPAFASVLKMAAAHPETSELAAELRVEWLIECRVAGEEDRINIFASMIDVSTDESREFFSSDIRSLDIGDTLNFFEISVFNNLGLTPPKGSFGPGFTSSLAALDQYLMGQEAMRDGTAINFEAALAHYRNAQQAAPFRLARLREADVMIRMFEVTSAAGPAAALKAYSLLLDEIELYDPVPAGLYASRLRLANIADRHETGPDVSEAQRLEWLERARALQPSFAEPYWLFAEYLSANGRDDEAAEYLARAKELAPGLQSPASATGTTW